MDNEPRTPEDIRDSDVTKPEAAERRTPRLPLALTIGSLIVWFGFQTAQLVIERNNLSSLKGNLEAATQESQKMRAQLETLITKTAELAKQGNPGAKAVIEELEKRGIPIQAATQPSK
ncbi:MAG: hypothetical protein HYV04_04525 [Deltaproteobacteria bacterium]|nr:hypothetical protein [Deltaproteobacteria bacterium]